MNRVESSSDRSDQVGLASTGADQLFGEHSLKTVPFLAFFSSTFCRTPNGRGAILIQEPTQTDKN